MYQYKLDNKQYIGHHLPEGAVTIDAFQEGFVYYEYANDQDASNSQHIIHDEDFILKQSNTVLGALSAPKGDYKALIEDKRLIGVNTCKKQIVQPLKKGYKVNVLGLGDVGGIMLSGLRLLSGDTISQVGIYDLDENKMDRWVYELNQIYTEEMKAPDVIKVDFDNIFDCDAFIFTASSAIPEVGSGVQDVRMYQLEKNAKIIGIYAKAAAKAGFKGQFIVVSDPVDLLCKAVLDLSEGALMPEQIKGFGLGVMHARARFYAKKNEYMEYFEEGRAFGPHGKHLIIANSMKTYNQMRSLKLTEDTVRANLDVRAVGYKPFIAPALSSAALSILKCLRGEWHYSTAYFQGVYFGCKNRQVMSGLTEVEQYSLDKNLQVRINETVVELKKYEF
jgi:malate/lactate dehydrogenase